MRQQLLRTQSIFEIIYRSVSAVTIWYICRDAALFVDDDASPVGWGLCWLLFVCFLSSCRRSRTDSYCVPSVYMCAFDVRSSVPERTFVQN